MEENVESEKENEGNEGLDNRKGKFWEEDSNWKPNDKKFHVSFF